MNLLLQRALLWQLSGLKVRAFLRLLTQSVSNILGFHIKEYVVALARGASLPGTYLLHQPLLSLAGGSWTMPCMAHPLGLCDCPSLAYVCTFNGLYWNAEEGAITTCL